MSQQVIFQNGAQYFLLDLYEDGKVTLKVKEEGWSDTWSLPLEIAYDRMGGHVPNN